MAAGGGRAALVPRAVGHAEHRAAGARARPTASTTTRTTRRRPWAGPRSTSARAGRKDQRRREHRHDVLTYTSPVLTEDLTVIGPLTAELYLRSSLEHTDFFVRLCDVTGEGQVVQHQRRHRPARARLGAQGGGRRLPAGGRHVADGEHVPGRPPHPAPGLERGPPAVLPQHRHRRAARHGDHHALGGPGGLPRRRPPVVDLVAGRAAPGGRSGSARAPEWVPGGPSANLPRMTQPTFVPIAEADQVRPARHLHVPGSWTTSRPAELVTPSVARGRDVGTPGPDSGFALRLARRFEHELQLGEGESEHDVLLGVALVAAKRAALFGRAPSIYDVRLALGLWGFLGDAPPELRGDAARPVLLHLPRLRRPAAARRLRSRGDPPAQPRGGPRPGRCHRGLGAAGPRLSWTQRGPSTGSR